MIWPMLHRLKTEGYKLQANVLIFLDYNEIKTLAYDSNSITFIYLLVIRYMTSVS